MSRYESWDEDGVQREHEDSALQIDEKRVERH